MRLPERFRTEALVSLGSRIKLRMLLEPYDRTVLLDYLEHGLAQAGAPHLMKPTKETLVDHAAGNLLILNNLAMELLARGVHQEVAQLDEKIFLEIFARQPAVKRRKAATPVSQ